jgi:hypothetical protein
MAVEAVKIIGRCLVGCEERVRGHGERKRDAMNRAPTTSRKIKIRRKKGEEREEREERGHGVPCPYE